MLSWRARRKLRITGITEVEWSLLLGGLVLLLAAVTAAMVAGDAGGGRRSAAIAGIVALVACAASRGRKVLRAGASAALPTSVGRTAVPIRPARGFGAVTTALSLGLPLVAAAALLALVEWAWLPVAAILLMGGAHTIAGWLEDTGFLDPRSPGPPNVESMLQRLCMRADMTVPELVSEPYAIAGAWTSHGRIHITTGLIALLDDRELEAVLAHEVAHLARRDAAVIEICAAPSRVLIGFTDMVPRRPPFSVWTSGSGALWPLALWVLAVLCIPPAVVIGHVSRLSVLGASRAREFSADAAASVLTGRPSALASALLKIEADGGWAPAGDLRATAVLQIVGTSRPGLGRLLSTHPPTAERVERLERMETRLSSRGPAAPRAARLVERLRR